LIRTEILESKFRERAVYHGRLSIRLKFKKHLITHCELTVNAVLVSLKFHTILSSRQMGFQRVQVKLSGGGKLRHRRGGLFWNSSNGSHPSIIAIQCFERRAVERSVKRGIIPKFSQG